MRKRMLRRKQLLSNMAKNAAAAVDRAVSPPAAPNRSQSAASNDAVFVAADAHARRPSADTISSIISSLCSAPSLMDNYGLHRALTSLVVPNDSNPIPGSP